METLRTLPGDDVRQIMWRFTDRFDLQMVIQSARTIARGLVARMVADGVRNSHDWNERKAEMLTALDEAGITAMFMDVEHGGFIEGPKNLALALVAFELAWVDGGASTGALAGNLALAPIHERGTPEQRARYMSLAVPPAPGEDRLQLRGAFALTEPPALHSAWTPGVVGGKVRVADWPENGEPMLHVEKRGRFITNMGFANFATVAVNTDDPRIKTSCMVILEEDDPGLWDRGAPTRKMVHQLSSTNDPIFSKTVPASRIIGGYTVEDGVIVPKYSHGEIIAAVFHRTRVTVGLMTSAKLLSAIEPVIRYHRQRFRGGDCGGPGTPRFDLGLQMKEDALQRLIDVWGTGEAASSLGFATARAFDALDPSEKVKDALFEERGIKTSRAQMTALKKVSQEAIELLGLRGACVTNDRREALESDPLVTYVLNEAVSSVLCPACKLWNTGVGATVMREAVALVGGYGITEDCPGFLGHKWMDAQLEATYEGPEAVQRRQLSVTMVNPVFLSVYKTWIAELRTLDANNPPMGAEILARAMELWLWTLDYLENNKDPEGKKLYHGNRHGVTFPLADALCWLLAPRELVMDVLELAAKGPENPVVAEGLEGLLSFYRDLCLAQAARSAGEAGRICTELVYGYTPPQGDCLAAFGALKAGLDASLAGARLAKDRAANALTGVMIPEALDYPL